MSTADTHDDAAPSLVRTDSAWLIAPQACMWTLVQHEPMGSRAWRNSRERWRREACETLPIAPQRACIALLQLARDHTLACAVDRELLAATAHDELPVRPATFPAELLADLEKERGEEPGAAAHTRRWAQRALDQLVFLPDKQSDATLPVRRTARPSWQALAVLSTWAAIGLIAWLACIEAHRAWAWNAQRVSQRARLALAQTAARAQPPAAPTEASAGSHATPVSLTAPSDVDYAPATCTLHDLATALTSLAGGGDSASAGLPAGTLRWIEVDAQRVRARVGGFAAAGSGPAPAANVWQRLTRAGWRVEASHGCERTMTRERQPADAAQAMPPHPRSTTGTPTLREGRLP